MTLAILAGCHSTSASMREPEYRTLTSAVPARDEAGTLHDAVAASTGIPSLSTSALSPGTRELRLSTGVGMIAGADYAIVRIVQDSKGARGELWRFHQKPGASSLDDLVARRVPLPSANWSAILARLDSLGVDSLRVSTAAATWTDLDELLIESRRGASYQSTSIYGASRRSGAAARRAVIIESVIDSLDRAAPR